MPQDEKEECSGCMDKGWFWRISTEDWGEWYQKYCDCLAGDELSLLENKATLDQIISGLKARIARTEGTEKGSLIKRLQYFVQYFEDL